MVLAARLRPVVRPVCSCCTAASRHSLPRYVPARRFIHAPPRTPDFAFAFDIDGVLVRASTPLPRAHAALSYLQRRRIPFILLTNGGGKGERERVAELSRKLDVLLDTGMFVQSHTPFAELDEYKDEPVLIVGGEGDNCRRVAEGYGFTTAITPADIFVAAPHMWPFSTPFLDYYRAFARPLPKPLYIPPTSSSSPSPSQPPSRETHLSLTAMLVFNDPRDWGLDLHVLLDALLSHAGILGTFSPRNNDAALPNRGYQQDAQPALFFSNPDLWWAAAWHLPRLGQGGFREALEGVWAAATGGEKAGVSLHKKVWGKPWRETYLFAEKRLAAHRAMLLGQQGVAGVRNLAPLRKVYMVGDNPESDIRGANMYESPHGTEWRSLLVKTGVYQDGTTPSYTPTTIVEDVEAAVQWAVKDAGWEDGVSD
ncbi:HAD-like domain-containing protein [Lineolata rhizophorae]|uniref:HAD-like domain-containing protein n=1 Tax=Lineolata rhizophorae TaxID=578093 RepID=A0A6A6P9Q7_9PEZI|nr:HAD-like domain-containing protein [Lineolata rhizophorae]